MNREIWIDSAKGFSMILVVLLHVSGWIQNDKGISYTIWFTVSDYLTPLRMPLFFFISGLLVSRSAKKKPKKVLVTALSLYTVYLFWTNIHSLRLLFFPSLSTDVNLSLELVFWNSIVPGLYWYIWALPVYYLVIVGVNTLNFNNTIFHFFLVLLAAAGCLYSSELGTLWNSNLDLIHKVEFSYTDSVLRNFLWFLLGAVYVDKAFSVTSRIKKNLSFITLGVVSVILGFIIGNSEYDFVSLIISPVLSVIGTVILLNIIEGTYFSRINEYIGTRTLAIYVMHWLVLNVMSFILIVFKVKELPDWAGGVLPPVLTAIVIVTCLIGKSLIFQMKLGFLLIGFPKYLRVSKTN